MPHPGWHPDPIGQHIIWRPFQRYHSWPDQHDGRPTETRQPATIMPARRNDPGSPQIDLGKTIGRQAQAAVRQAANNFVENRAAHVR